MLSSSQTAALFVHCLLNNVQKHYSTGWKDSKGKKGWLLNEEHRNGVRIKNKLTFLKDCTVRKGYKLLFVLLPLKNSNFDTKIRWWHIEVYTRTVELNLDVPSLKHPPASSLFIEWLSCPKHFIDIIPVISWLYNW